MRETLKEILVGLLVMMVLIFAAIGLQSIFDGPRPVLSPQQVQAICAGVEGACVDPVGSTGHVNCERALDNCVKAKRLGR